MLLAPALRVSSTCRYSETPACIALAAADSALERGCMGFGFNDAAFSTKAASWCCREAEAAWEREVARLREKVEAARKGEAEAERMLKESQMEIQSAASERRCVPQTCLPTRSGGARCPPPHPLVNMTRDPFALAERCSAPVTRSRLERRVAEMEEKAKELERKLASAAESRRSTEMEQRMRQAQEALTARQAEVASVKEELEEMRRERERATQALQKAQLEIRRMKQEGTGGSATEELEALLRRERKTNQKLMAVRARMYREFVEKGERASQRH